MRSCENCKNYESSEEAIEKEKIKSEMMEHLDSLMSRGKIYCEAYYSILECSMDLLEKMFETGKKAREL